MQFSQNSPGAMLTSLISPNHHKPRLLLVTGPRGAGKTRWCMDMAGRARARGLCLRGLVSPAVFEDGQKTGIALEDLQTGERRQLAHRKGAEDGDIHTQDWQIMAETLEWGNSILEKIETCDLFILDEVGPFELEHGGGFVAGLELVAHVKDFPCVAVVRPSLVETARARWEWAQVLDLTTGADS